MEPRTPDSRIPLNVPRNIQTNSEYTEERINGDLSHQAPFLSPVSSVGSTSPSSCNLKSHSIRYGKNGLKSSKEVFICERYSNRTDENCYMDDQHERENLNDEKATAILTCLDGDFKTEPEENAFNCFKQHVSLWELRQLALSLGGLLHSSIRKRAWLNLLDTNDQIFEASIGSNISRILRPQHLSESISTPSYTVILSNDEINLIQEDIENCRWSIEALIAETREMNYDTNISVNVSEKISNVVKIEEMDSSHFTVKEFVNDGICDSLSDVSQSDHSKLISSEEQSLLLNIILSVLRDVPDNSNRSTVEEAERLYYFQGMYNIAAILLITLQSPSLSTIAIKKLSSSHLQDYFAPSFLNLQSAIRVIFMPLLNEVDTSLCKIFLAHGVNDPCPFVLPWIICWYANDVIEYEVICRLFDVFLSGHALLPIYFAAAFLVHPWSKNRLQENQVVEGSAEFVSLLSTIPSRMVSTQKITIAFQCIEEVIELGLNYIKMYPPDQILLKAKSSSDKVISSSAIHAESIASFQDPPSWTYKSFTINDWTLIQEAKKLRSLHPNTCQESMKKMNSRQINNVSNEQTLPMLDIDKALDASGLQESAKGIILSKRKRLPVESRLKQKSVRIYALAMSFIFIPISLLKLLSEPIFYDKNQSSHNMPSCTRDLSLTVMEYNNMTRHAFHMIDSSNSIFYDNDESVSWNYYKSSAIVRSTLPRNLNRNIYNQTALSSLPHEEQTPNRIDDSVLETFLLTLPFTCNDSWCKIPIDIMNTFYFTESRTNTLDSTSSARRHFFKSRWNGMIKDFITFARDLFHDDPECFFAFS